MIVQQQQQEQLNSIASVYTAYINGQLPQDQTPAQQQSIPNISGQLAYNQTTQFLNQFVIAYNTATPPSITTAQWVPLAVMVTGEGDPNGLQAGILNWQYYDTTGMQMYVCTTAGSANGTPSPQAVWTAV